MKGRRQKPEPDPAAGAIVRAEKPAPATQSVAYKNFFFTQSAFFQATIPRPVVQELIHVITHEIKARGVLAPFILLPFRPESDARDVRDFIGQVIPKHSPPLQGDSLLREVRLADVYCLATVLKWCWCRLPGGIVSWKAYNIFREEEHKAGYPMDAFITIIPRCVESESHANILFDFFDLMASVATHGRHNGMGGRKLSRLAGTWAFDIKKPGFKEPTSFADGLAAWSQAAEATNHLFFAFLRSLCPSPKLTAKPPDASIRLPKSLEALLVSSVYPPQPLYKSRLVAVPMVSLTVGKLSANPMVLLRRVAKTIRFDNPAVFSSEDDFNTLYFLFAEPAAIQYKVSPESLRVIQEIIDENPLVTDHPILIKETPRLSFDLRARTWSKFYNHAYIDPVTGDLRRPLTNYVYDENQLEEIKRVGVPSQEISALPYPDTPRSGSARGRGELEGVKSGYDQAMTSARITADGLVTAAVSQIAIDDFFVWVWMSSMSQEQTEIRKATFGRSVIVELEVAPGERRWVVVEEVLHPEPAPMRLPVEPKDKPLPVVVAQRRTASSPVTTTVRDSKPKKKPSTGKRTRRKAHRVKSPASEAMPPPPPLVQPTPLEMYSNLDPLVDALAKRLQKNAVTTRPPQQPAPQSQIYADREVQTETYPVSTQMQTSPELKPPAVVRRVPSPVHRPQMNDFSCQTEAFDEPEPQPRSVPAAQAPRLPQFAPPLFQAAPISRAVPPAGQTPISSQRANTPSVLSTDMPFSTPGSQPADDDDASSVYYTPQLGGTDQFDSKGPTAQMSSLDLSDGTPRGLGLGQLESAGTTKTQPVSLHSSPFPSLVSPVPHNAPNMPNVLSPPVNPPQVPPKDDDTHVLEGSVPTLAPMRPLDTQVPDDASDKPLPELPPSPPNESQINVPATANRAVTRPVPPLSTPNRTQVPPGAIVQPLEISPLAPSWISTEPTIDTEVEAFMRGKKLSIKRKPVGSPNLAQGPTGSPTMDREQQELVDTINSLVGASEADAFGDAGQRSQALKDQGYKDFPNYDRRTPPYAQEGPSHQPTYDQDEIRYPPRYGRGRPSSPGGRAGYGNGGQNGHNPNHQLMSPFNSSGPQGPPQMGPGGYRGPPRGRGMPQRPMDPMYGGFDDRLAYPPRRPQDRNNGALRYSDSSQGFYRPESEEYQLDRPYSPAPSSSASQPPHPARHNRGPQFGGPRPGDPAGSSAYPPMPSSNKKKDLRNNLDSFESPFFGRNNMAMGKKIGSSGGSSGSGSQPPFGSASDQRSSSMGMRPMGQPDFGRPMGRGYPRGFQGGPSPGGGQGPGGMSGHPGPSGNSPGGPGMRAPPPLGLPQPHMPASGRPRSNSLGSVPPQLPPLQLEGRLTSDLNNPVPGFSPDRLRRESPPRSGGDNSMALVPAQRPGQMRAVTSNAALTQVSKTSTDSSQWMTVRSNLDRMRNQFGDARQNVPAVVDDSMYEAEKGKTAQSVLTGSAAPEDYYDAVVSTVRKPSIHTGDHVKTITIQHDSSEDYGSHRSTPNPSTGQDSAVYTMNRMAYEQHFRTESGPGPNPYERRDESSSSSLDKSSKRGSLPIMFDPYNELSVARATRAGLLDHSRIAEAAKPEPKTVSPERADRRSNLLEPPRAPPKIAATVPAPAEEGEISKYSILGIINAAKRRSQQ